MPSITVDNEKRVKIVSSSTMIIRSAKADIEYDLKDGDYAVLIFNDSKKDLTISDHGQISNARVNITYIQLDDHDLIQNSHIDVNRDSSLTINATYLGSKNKDIIFDLVNNEPDSNIDITSNIVCLDESAFRLDCIGTIKKGSKRSKCHQASHCLTMGNPKKATVLPVLNIDENDVEASHSLSCGTIDDEILFYMNSRGLSSMQALNLILRSYLMPDEHFYDDFIDGKAIQEMAAKKVDSLCSM